MLLSTHEFRDQIASAVSLAEREVIILSAFLKKEGLEWILKYCEKPHVRVVARWQKHDLICKASDLECFELCRDLGIGFGVSQNLHGKVLLIDDHVFVGSSNLTSRGFGLTKKHNDEFGVGYKAGVADKAKIRDYLVGVQWLDNRLYSQIVRDIDESPKNVEFGLHVWPVSIREQFKQNVSHLWVHEILHTTPKDLLALNLDDPDHVRDMGLLGAQIDDLSSENLSIFFRKTKQYAYLRDLLAPGESKSFGGITKCLHDAILDDPSPYRKNVKVLVSVLFAWCSLLDEFEITKPNHSQILRRLD